MTPLPAPQRNRHESEFRLVHGRLLLLQQVHATVQGELQTLLDDEESFPPQE